MLDGIGSYGHVVGRLPVRILETSLSVRWVKEGNNEPLTVLPLGGGDSWLHCFPMAATCSVEKEAKVSAVRLVANIFANFSGLAPSFSPRYTLHRLNIPDLSIN